MAVIVIHVNIHDRRVQVGCYGSGSDWVCRLTDPTAQPQNSVADDFCPAPDLGFAWFREVGGRMWVASALVNRDVFKDADTVDELLYHISEKVIGRDEQLARCIEFVRAEFTTTFDGELGLQQAAGGWAEVRWWQRKGHR